MDDDGDVRRLAIELRVDAPTRHSNQAEVIDLVESDDDEDFQAQLRTAIEASKLERPFRTSSTEPTHDPQSGSQSPLSTFLSERAQLEKERLARQKRSHPEILADGDSAHDEIVTKQPRLLSTESVATSPADETQLFLHGELRQTAVQHAHPRKDGKLTFCLTDILGKKSELAFAIISSFSLNIAWIYQFFDPSVPVILVAQPSVVSGDQPRIHYILPNWIKTEPRLRGGHGCMHMKFMLLFYKSSRLRVVISTANLVEFDFRDVENTIWLQDILPRTRPLSSPPGGTDDFPYVMQEVLHAVHVRPALAAMLSTHPNLPLKVISDLSLCWDWSSVRAKLAPSLAGKHEGWKQVLRTGHTRLRRIVRDMKLSMSENKLVLECQGSSIGSYTTQWLNEFYHSAIGKEDERWLDLPLKRRKQQEWPPVKIVYPSLQTVQASILGRPGGGTMFCRRSQWEAQTFPRHLFHDSNSKAGRVLMHSKMIIAVLQDVGKGLQKQTSISSNSETESDDDVVEIVEPFVGWIYVGSHNLTPSAWGTLSGSNVNPTLNCSNYELGVVLPLKDYAEPNRICCFERPPRKYRLERDLPWLQEEHLI